MIMRVHVLLGLVTLAASAQAEPWLESSAAVLEWIAPVPPTDPESWKTGDRIVLLDSLENPDLGQVLAWEADWSLARSVPCRIQRGPQLLDRTLAQGARAWIFRPDWSPSAQDRANTALSLANEEHLAELEVALDHLATELEASGHVDAALWLYAQTADRLKKRVRWPESARIWSLLEERAAGPQRNFWLHQSWLGQAHAAFRLGDQTRAAALYARAEEAATQEGSGPRQAHARGPGIDLQRLQGDLYPAQKRGEELVQQWQSLAPDSLEVAAALTRLGIVYWFLADLDQHERCHRRAFEIRSRLAPDSLELAVSLRNLGELERGRGNMAKAKELHLQALTLRQRLAQNSLEAAMSKNDLGILAHYSSSFEEARLLWLEALPVYERELPDTLDIAWIWNNLGVNSMAQGLPAEAIRYNLKALALRERLLPNSPAVAYSLMNLSGALAQQGNFDGARSYIERSLSILYASAQDSGDVALCYHSLGDLNFAEGRWSESREFYLKALSIWEKTGMQQGVGNANQLTGATLYFEGRLDEAEVYLRRGLEIQRKLLPGSIDLMWSLHHLGLVLTLRGQPIEAQQMLQEALGLFERLNPNTIAEATSLKAMGLFFEVNGDPRTALSWYSRAVDLVESFRNRVGSTRVRTEFAENSLEFYHALLKAQVSLNRTEDAFHTLERSRARALIEMLTEQQLETSSSLTPAFRAKLEDLHSRQRRMADALGALGPEASDAAVAEWKQNFARLTTEEDQLAEEIRASVPEYAALAYPQPLDFPAVEASLAPGTLLLGYSVGKQDAYLLAALKPQTGPTVLQAHRLQGGLPQLGEKVWMLRSLLMRSGPDGVRGQEWQTGAAALYQNLLQPVQPLLDQAQRVLVLPDGPLHLVPFAVLGPQSKAPLGARMPITVLPSVTLHERLRSLPRPKSAGPNWVGVGSPRYPQAPEQQPEALEELQRGGLRLRPLPGAAVELSKIASLMGEEAQLYLDQDATEERARSLPRNAEVVHFACHGLLDDRFPMHSALALSLPSKHDGKSQDGLLQVWEVFQDVRLDSEMVVLSGCETGLGHLQGGEGLLGLSRAFFFAGARSLLVSFWPIEDRSTALFMETFYAALLEGLPKDEALHQARLRFQQTPQLAHPYYWAAFQLVGDRQPLSHSKASLGALRVAAALLFLLAGLAFLVFGVRGSRRA